MHYMLAEQPRLLPRLSAESHGALSEVCAQEVELHIRHQHNVYSKQIGFIPMPVQIVYA